MVEVLPEDDAELGLSSFASVFTRGLFPLAAAPGNGGGCCCCGHLVLLVLPTLPPPAAVKGLESVTLMDPVVLTLTADMGDAVEALRAREDAGHRRCASEIAFLKDVLAC